MVGSVCSVGIDVWNVKVQEHVRDVLVGTYPMVFVLITVVSWTMVMKWGYVAIVRHLAWNAMMIQIVWVVWKATTSTEHFVWNTAQQILGVCLHWGFALITVHIILLHQKCCVCWNALTTAIVRDSVWESVEMGRLWMEVWDVWSVMIVQSLSIEWSLLIVRVGHCC